MAGVSTLAGLEGDSGALDAEIEKAFREKQKEPPGPSTSILNAIAGVGAQLSRNRDRVTGTLASYSNQLEKIESQIDDLEDPLNGDLKREVRRLRLSSERLREKAEPNRVVRTVTTNTAKSLAAIAKEVGMDLADLLKLNQRLATSPTVPANTRVLFYGD